jgi:hypothetical protein
VNRVDLIGKDISPICQPDQRSSGGANWTVHDIRRTVRTGLGELGVAPHVAEAVLNHLPAKLIRTYDRNTYEPEKRAALDNWANHIRFIIAQSEGANVHKLKRIKPIPA